MVGENLTLVNLRSGASEIIDVEEDDFWDTSENRKATDFHPDRRHFVGTRNTARSRLTVPALKIVRFAN